MIRYWLLFSFVNKQQSPKNAHFKRKNVQDSILLPEFYLLPVSSFIYKKKCLEIYSAKAN
jgi:hypothetical protein